LLVYHDLNETVYDPMTYYDSVNRGGVRVDGQPDALDGALPEWRFWTASSSSGIEGSLWSADRIESSFADPLLAASSNWYLDDANPPYPQCWGDSQAIGQSGIRSTYSIPNTDPRSTPTEQLRMTTTELSTLPVASAEMAVTLGDTLADELAAPLAVTAKPVRLDVHR
jgi:hypothetical protein